MKKRNTKEIVRYQTGIFESDVLGSDHRCSCLFYTNDEAEAFNEAKKCGRNYLSKRVATWSIEPKKLIREISYYYDWDSGNWLE